MLLQFGLERVEFGDLLAYAVSLVRDASKELAAESWRRG